MDQLSTLEAKQNRTPLFNIPQHLMLHLTCPRIPAQHPNLSQQTDWTLYYRCKRQYPFCKHISKRLLNGKAPKQETNVFTYSKGLLYKHITESGKQFIALIIPKSWKCMVLVEAHDKLGHQGNTHTYTYCLIKRQYCWKGMNKDIRKYIATCALCHREKAKAQQYPLQMTEIPDRPFNRIHDWPCHRMWHLNIR